MSSTMVASFSRELFLDALKNEAWNVATAMFEAFSEKCYKVLNERTKLECFFRKKFLRILFMFFLSVRIVRKHSFVNCRYG
jgi:hypothetical protein